MIIHISITTVIPEPTEAILGAETILPAEVPEVFGIMMEALLLPVKLADVLTTGTVIDFCRTLGDVCPDDTKITFIKSRKQLFKLQVSKDVFTVFLT